MAVKTELILVLITLCSHAEATKWGGRGRYPDSEEVTTPRDHHIVDTLRGSIDGLAQLFPNAGSRGLTGATGATGPQGLPGKQGLRGNQGLPGPPGAPAGPSENEWTGTQVYRLTKDTKLLLLISLSLHGLSLIIILILLIALCTLCCRVNKLKKDYQRYSKLGSVSSGSSSFNNDYKSTGDNPAGLYQQLSRENNGSSVHGPVLPYEIPVDSKDRVQYEQLRADALKKRGKNMSIKETNRDDRSLKNNDIRYSEAPHRSSMPRAKAAGHPGYYDSPRKSKKRESIRSTNSNTSGYLEPVNSPVSSGQQQSTADMRQISELEKQPSVTKDHHNRHQIDPNPNPYTHDSASIANSSMRSHTYLELE